MATFLRQRYQPPKKAKRTPRLTAADHRLCSKCGATRARKKSGLCKACTHQRHDLHTREGYAQYLRSEHWADVKARQPKTPCRLCGSEENLHLHHQTYESLGNEAPDDLAWLCRPCHKSLHKRGDSLRIDREEVTGSDGTTSSSQMEAERALSDTA